MSKEGGEYQNWFANGLFFSLLLIVPTFVGTLYVAAYFKPEDDSFPWKALGVGVFQVWLITLGMIMEKIDKKIDRDWKKDNA